MIDRYSDEEIQHIWSEEYKYNLWGEIEYAHLNVLTDSNFPPIPIDVEEIKEIERETKHDVVAFVRFLYDSSTDHEFRRWLHYGLTSSDIVDTAYVIRCRESIRILIGKVDSFIHSIRKRQYGIRGVKSIGRTHGVHAEEIEFESKFGLFVYELTRVKDLLELVEDKYLRFGKMSGAVGDNKYITREQEERILDRFKLKPIFHSTQILPRDLFSFMFFVLAQLGSVVERFALEVRLLARTECGEMMEGFGEGQVGSSAMPHKRNPIGSENLTGIARMLRSYVNPSLENIVLWHERDISHSSVERVITPDAFNLSCYMVDRMSEIVKNLVIDEENIRKNLEMVDSNSQGVMNNLIVDEGLERFEAYRKSKDKLG